MLIANIITLTISGYLIYEFTPNIYAIGNTSGYIFVDIPSIGRIRVGGILESIINGRTNDPPPTSFPIKI